MRDALQQAAAAGTGAQPPAAAAAAEGDAAVPAAAATVALLDIPHHEDLPFGLHQAFLAAAFNLEQWPVFDELASLAALRLAHADACGPTTRASGEDAERLRAMHGVLTACRELRSAPGVAALKRLGSEISAAVHEASVVMQLQDVLSDASLALLQAARPLLDGVFCTADKEAATALELMAALHETWQAVGMDDGLLRGSVAVKLGGLLEQTGELHRAREVAGQVRLGYLHWLRLRLHAI